MYPIAILAGGLASRMHPRTSAVPKAMLDIAGQPFVAYQLTLLRDQGITDVVLCIGHFGDQIREFVGDGSDWSLRVHYSQDGDVLLGTGGALRRAAPLLGETFLVMYGDSYLRCDFRAVSEAFAASGRAGLMTVFRNDNRFGASNVLFDRGRIMRYDKVSPSSDMKHIDYGLSILTAGVLSGYPAATAFDLTQVYQDLIRTETLAGFEVPERFFEIGSPEGLRDTEVLLSEGRRR